MYIEFFVQAQELYGDHWKSKPAPDYLLPVNKDALLAADDRALFLRRLAEQGAALIEESSSLWRQWVIDWHLVEADHYTDFELNQLEYEGRITYWATVLELPQAA